MKSINIGKNFNFINEQKNASQSMGCTFLPTELEKYISRHIACEGTK